jgi:hypothetical protein
MLFIRLTRFKDLHVSAVCYLIVHASVFFNFECIFIVLFVLVVPVPDLC